MTLPFLLFLRRHGYFGRAKIAESHLHHATKLLSSGTYAETEDAISSLNSALQMYPDWEKPLELKAKALLQLKRYKEVVELLHLLLPSLNNNNGSSIINTDENNPMECFNTAANAKAKASAGKCFCIPSFLFKRKPSSSYETSNELADGNGGLEWRYLILGQACYHLGMMEDAMILLRKGKKVASEASRRRSNGIRDDDFCCHRNSVAILDNNASLIIKQRRNQARNGSIRKDPSCGIPTDNNTRDDIEENVDGSRGVSQSRPRPRPRPRREKIHKPHMSSSPCATDLNLINNMISNIKLLLRCRSAASIALESGLYSESARHLTKLIEGGKSAAPPWFITDCYLHRAIAYQAMGRVVDAIADCNRTLALNPKCVKALSVRASLHELVKSFTECLLDLQQLKMVFEANLRCLSMPLGTSSPSSQWTVDIQMNGSDVDMLSGLEYINNKIIAIRRRLSPGLCMLDARTILDMPEHCSMEDVEKAYLLISLKHSPDKVSVFLDACLQEGYCRDMEIAREEAKASAIRLSKLIHKAYTKLLATISEEEIEKQNELKRMRRGRSWHKRYEDMKHRWVSNMEEIIDVDSVESKDRIISTCIENGNASSDVVVASKSAGELVGESSERKIVDNEQGKTEVSEKDINLSSVLEAFKGFQLFGNLSEDQHWLNGTYPGPWSLLHPQPLSVT